MLAIWPLVCLVLFMRMPAPQALLWSVIGGYLLLPSATRLDLTGLPDLDKPAMIGIGAGLGTLMFGKRPGRLGGGWLFYGLGAVFVLSPVVTAYLNPDPIVGKALFFQGLTWYDGLSLAGGNLLTLIPFWAGRRLLATEAGHRRVLITIVVAMLAYSIPILIEVRLSPQIHRWVYGFFPHEFGQQMRAGGFRAVVFLTHGLVVALFLGLAVIGATGLARARERLFGVSASIVVVYLLIVLALQKSLGAMILTLLICFVQFVMKPRRQVVLAAIVSLLVCFYPAVRGSGLLPLESIQAMAESFSSDRAGSLQTRLVNEDRLLKKAAERPWFGWGSWGRNRVYDLEQGRDISITDGTWVIEIGSFGWVGYIAMFGLLAIPIVRLRTLQRRNWEIPAASTALTFLLVLNLCDLIPNSSLTPLTWLMAGALAGLTNRANPTGARGAALDASRAPGTADPVA